MPDLAIIRSVKRLLLRSEFIARFNQAYQVGKAYLRNRTKHGLLLELMDRPFYGEKTTGRESRIVRFIFEHEEKQPLIMEFLESGYYETDTSQDGYHFTFESFIKQMSQKKDCRILELGGRKINRKAAFEACQDYVVFDIYPDEGVDVSGDIHELSRYFEEESFDAVILVSVFEHLAMPWKAVLEINKVLKKDGLVFISTHPTWPAHDTPWDFWRFSRHAFDALFNQVTGFEIVEIAEGLPGSIFAFSNEMPMHGLHRQPANLGVSLFAMKTGDFDSRLSWDITLSEILDSTYPLPADLVEL